MISPFTAPDVGQMSSDDDDDNDIFDTDTIPQFQRMRSRSFDFADIDLTYSEDIASPIASISFIPRDVTKGAPMLPDPPTAAAEGFTLNTPENNHDASAPQSIRPEERQDRNLVYADYDLSDEEDDLLIGEENSLLENEVETLEDESDNQSNNDPRETSFHSAPLGGHHRRASIIAPNGESMASQLETESLLDLEVPSFADEADNQSNDPRETSFHSAPLRGHHRRASIIAPIGESMASQLETESLLDLEVPSFAPVPMRRASSTPVQQSRQQRGSMPPLSQNHNLQSPPSSRRRGSLPNWNVPSPYSTGYALRRQVSASSLSSMDRIKSPTIQFSDDPSPKDTISCGESTPKNNSSHGGASIFRSAGRAGSIVASPGGVRTPSPSKASRKSSERLTLSAPHPLRRHQSSPATSGERHQTSGSLFSSDAGTTGTARVEFHPRPRNHRRSSIYDEDWRAIKESPTGNTDVDSDVELARCNDMRERSLFPADPNGSDASARSKEEKIFFQRQRLLYMLYLSAFSIFGSTIRVFLIRLFELSCEASGSTMDEFCITATGRTMQRGGALFADLPANMVGCFIMGLMTTLQPDVWPPIPWLRADHPLQQHDAYHVGIRAGLCGSITTFASWNAQMIVMMDGTNTVLGSQVFTALSGYVVGFFCAIASFLVGTHVSIWLTRWRNPDIAREHDEEVRLTSPSRRRMEHEGEVEEREEGCLNQPPTSVAFPAFFSISQSSRLHWLCKGHLLPFVLVACLLVVYAILGFLEGNLFYRTLFYSSLFTPPGALIRWELSKWNSRLSQHHWGRFRWFPIGTFVANVLGSLVSIALLAVETRYLFDEANSNLWAISLVTALRTGFAGSLSTVSSMVKEMFELHAEFPQHAKAYHYALITVAVCVTFSIAVYSPIVRS